MIPLSTLLGVDTKVYPCHRCGRPVPGLYTFCDPCRALALHAERDDALILTSQGPVLPPPPGPPPPPPPGKP